MPICANGKSGCGQRSEYAKQLGALKTALFSRIAHEFGDHELLVYLALDEFRRRDYCRLHGLWPEYAAIEAHLQKEQMCDTI